MILTQGFFNRKTKIVARDLLGKVLVRQYKNKIISGMIVETEAYLGPHDLAAHSARGRTPRNEIMFGPPGFWYVYFIYGFYHCVNVVTEEEGHASAVLIRALEPLSGISEMEKLRKTKTLHNLASGPGKLCQALDIKLTLKGEPAFKNSNLYVEDRGIQIPKNKIVKAPRIGVDYAGIWKDKPLRFYIKDNKFVSKK